MYFLQKLKELQGKMDSQSDFVVSAEKYYIAEARIYMKIRRLRNLDNLSFDGKFQAFEREIFLNKLYKMYSEFEKDQEDFVESAVYFKCSNVDDLKNKIYQLDSEFKQLFFKVRAKLSACPSS